MKDVSKSYPKAFKPWTPEDDQTLVEGAHAGLTVIELSKKLERQPTALQRRAEKLGVSFMPGTRTSSMSPTDAFTEDEQRGLRRE